MRALDWESGSQGSSSDYIIKSQYVLVKITYFPRVSMSLHFDKIHLNNDTCQLIPSYQEGSMIWVCLGRDNINDGDYLSRYTS